VKKKLNLTKTWPVLLEDVNEWNVNQWNATEYHRYTVDFFIDTDVKNTSKRALYVSGPNLALSRDMLSKGFQDSNVRAYHEYMVSVATYFGANKTQAEEEFAQVLLYEMLLANVSKIYCQKLSFLIN
jgi:predicted metalloendopeptidase